MQTVPAASNNNNNQDTSSKSPNKQSAGGRSDTDLQHLRARFHATQFRFTSALAAEKGKAGDGAFRIQLKHNENLKPTKPPPKEIYEPIEAFENEEGLKGVEAKEPEYDMFASSTEDEGPLEEWDPAFIAEIQKKCNLRWREAAMVEDPLTDKAELEAILKRKADEAAAKEKEKKEKEKEREATSVLKPVTKSPSATDVLVKEAPLPTETLPSSAASSSHSKESVDSLHAPAFSPGYQSGEPLIPVTHLHQEVLGTLSREVLPADSDPSKQSSQLQQQLPVTPSPAPSTATAAATSTTTTKGAEPLFDCLENEIVLDDQYLSEIASGLKEGMTYDNAYVTDDLKKKLLEIDANKEKVEEELVRQALAREDAPVQTDATANKIVEALTNYEVVAKTVSVEDSKLLKDYFDGTRKADDEVIAALNRVIDTILDRAADFYPNKEELAPFLRNRGTAKSHLLDAMLSRKGGWIQNMFGSAYSTALAIYSGAGKTVEAVGKGFAVAKDVAGQSATMARDYAASTVDAVNKGYTKANELAEQSATVAREVASKGSEMYSKAADVASYSTEQARRVASVTAMFAGKVSSVVSSASSSLTSASTSSSSTSVASTSSGTSATSEASSLGSVTGSETGSNTPASTTSTTPSEPSGSKSSTSAGSIVNDLSTPVNSNPVSVSSSASSGSVVDGLLTPVIPTPASSTSSSQTSLPPAAVSKDVNEMKSTEEEEKSPARHAFANSPAPLTFRGFLDAPSPPQKLTPPTQELQMVKKEEENGSSILSSAWKLFTVTLMGFWRYGGGACSGSQAATLSKSREHESRPEEDDKKKND